jgi:Raf kinase inhibitor-like YbhB/YbcL family protein
MNLAIPLLALALAAPADTAAPRKAEPAPFRLRSSSFDQGTSIPARHTCEDGDASPSLRWSGAPDSTKSFALIVDDPDAPDPAAPRAVWVHWVLYNIPADASALPESATTRSLPAGTRSGVNDWKQPIWRGPCPPVGEHRYFFKLYALDIVLPDLGRPTKAALEKAMAGHVLAKAELMGKYKKGAGAGAR